MPFQSIFKFFSGSFTKNDPQLDNPVNSGFSSNDPTRVDEAKENVNLMVKTPETGNASYQADNGEENHALVPVENPQNWKIITLNCCHEVIELDKKLKAMPNAKEAVGKHVKTIDVTDLDCHTCNEAAKQRTGQNSFQRLYQMEGRRRHFYYFLYSGAGCRKEFQNILDLCPNLEKFYFRDAIDNNRLRFLFYPLAPPPNLKITRACLQKEVEIISTGKKYDRFVEHKIRKQHEGITEDILEQFWKTLDLDCPCTINKVYQFFREVPQAGDLYGRYVKNVDLSTYSIVCDRFECSQPWIIDSKLDHDLSFCDCYWYHEYQEIYQDLEFIFQLCPNIEHVYFDDFAYNDQIKKIFPNVSFSKLVDEKQEVKKIRLDREKRWGVKKS